MLPTSIQVQRRASGLPCAMALRLIRDRPGDPAFRDTIALRPRWRPSNLTPASGRRTQTISPYAKAALVSRNLASTAPCPSFATMANAPLVGQDGGSCAFDLPDEASDLFLAATLDGPNHPEIAEEISVGAQANNWPAPHGEERVFARLRTMLRIAGRTMRPAAHLSRRRLRGSSG